MFQQFIEFYKDQYQRLPRNKKRELTIEVLLKLQQQKGIRFLKSDAGRWVELDESEALEKVSHCLRKKPLPKLKKLTEEASMELPKGNVARLPSENGETEISDSLTRMSPRDHATAEFTNFCRPTMTEQSDCHVFPLFSQEMQGSRYNSNGEFSTLENHLPHSKQERRSVLPVQSSFLGFAKEEILQTGHDCLEKEPNTDTGMVAFNKSGNKKRRRQDETHNGQTLTGIPSQFLSPAIYPKEEILSTSPDHTSWPMHKSNSAEATKRSSSPLDQSHSELRLPLYSSEERGFCFDSTKTSHRTEIVQGIARVTRQRLPSFDESTNVLQDLIGEDEEVLKYLLPRAEAQQERCDEVFSLSWSHESILPEQDTTNDARDDALSLIGLEEPNDTTYERKSRA